MKNKLMSILFLFIILIWGFQIKVFAMQIFVKTLTGKTITLEVEPGDLMIM